MKLSARRFLAASTAAAVATVGTLAMTAPVDASPSTAQIAAKKKANKNDTGYGLGASAYGTYVEAGLAGLVSDKVANTWLSCTSLAGKEKHTALLGADVLPGNALLNVGVVNTKVRSFKGTYKSGLGTVAKQKKIAGGSQAVSKVAGVKLGPTNGPNLEIKGLETYATTWADKKGKFHADHGYEALQIIANTGIKPLDDLLNGSNSPIKTLVDLLLDGIVKDVVIDQVVNGVLTIAGLGEIKLGHSYSLGKATGPSKIANAVALRVHLYGLDMKKGGGDDIIARIGHARTRIVRDVKAGRFRGEASAINANVLGQTLATARLAHQPLPCEGTDGKVLTESVAGLNLLNANLIDVQGVSSSVYAKRGKKKANPKRRTAKAWTEARVAKVVVGGNNGLVLDAIIGRANAQKKANGKIVRNSNGTRVGKIVLAGNEISLDQLLDPVLTAAGGLLNSLGIASIEQNVTKKTRRGIQVVALQIKLFDGNVANIEIGKAYAKIAK